MISGLGTSLTSILTARFGQALKDMTGNTKTEVKGRSLTDAANVTNIIIPFILTPDIVREKGLEAAKNAEIKLAWDMKKIASVLLEDTTGGVNNIKFENLIKKLPITVLNKAEDGASTVNGVELTNFLFGENVNVIDMTESDIMANKLEQEAISYAIDVIESPDRSYYSEVDIKTGIITDRASVPTQIQMKIKYGSQRDGESVAVREIEYIVSIHTIIRRVDETDLLNRLIDSDGRKFWKDFVKYEKGEISFFGDLLLQLNNLKRLAQTKARRTEGDIFDTIDRYKLLQNLGQNVYPFTTIMVSEEFNNKLKASGLDMKRDIVGILDSLLGLGAFIYYQDTDLVDVYYDGDTGFTTYTFDEITKDTLKYEKQIKELLRFNVK